MMAVGINASPRSKEKNGEQGQSYTFQSSAVRWKGGRVKYAEIQMLRRTITTGILKIRHATFASFASFTTDKLRITV